MISGGIAWALIMLLGNNSSAGVLRGTQFEVSALTVLPGLTFGLLIGLLWHRRGMASRPGVLGYTVAAGVAYFISFHIAGNVFDRLSGWLREDVALVVSGIFAGLIGCCFLGVVTANVLRIPYQSALGLPVLVGGVASGFLPLINLPGDWGFLAFLVLWQGAYAAGLVRLLPAPAVLTRAASMGVGKSRA
jgi:hypothetical protein